MSAPTEPETPALLAWEASSSFENIDRPQVRTWMPSGTPYAILQTTTVGCGDDRREVLHDPKRPLVDVHLAGVSIGGYLEEMEMFFDAARDALRLARYHADVIIARESGGVS